MDHQDFPKQPISFSETRRRLRADTERIRTMLSARFESAPIWLWFDISFQCVLLHRLSHYFWRRGARKSARLCMQVNSILTGADFHPNSDIGGGLLVPNPVTIAVSGSAGENLTLMPLSGLGMLPRATDVGAGPGVALLGDNIWMGAGSGVLGPVRVGTGTRVDPGASLTRTTPENCVVEMLAKPVEHKVEDVSLTRNTHSAQLACQHGIWLNTLSDINQDILRYLEIREGNKLGPHGMLRKLSALLTTELMGVAVYRVAHYGYASGKTWLAKSATLLNQLLFKLSIDPGSCIGGGLFLPHPAGVRVSAHVGRGATLYVRTICASGSPSRRRPEDGPRLGDRVLISGMGAALGHYCVGDDVRLGFNIQLCMDSPPGQSVASAVMRTRHEAHEDAGAPIYQLVRQLRPSIHYSEMREMLAADRKRANAICDGSLQWSAMAAVTLYRYGSWFWACGCSRTARFLWRLNLCLTGADIDPRSEIGGGFLVPDPAGLSVHCRAGRNLTVLALACIGPSNARHPTAFMTSESPSLGNSVTVHEHASLSGPIRVGDSATIGPGCKITWDVHAQADLITPKPRMRQVVGVESEDDT